MYVAPAYGRTGKEGDEELDSFAAITDEPPSRSRCGRPRLLQHSDQGRAHPERVVESGSESLKRNAGNSLEDRAHGHIMNIEWPV